MTWFLGWSCALLVAVFPLCHAHGSEFLIAADVAEVVFYLAALVLVGVGGEVLVTVGLHALGIRGLAAGGLVALRVGLQQIRSHVDLHLRGLVLLLLELLVGDLLHETDLGLLLLAHVADHGLDLVLERLDLALDVHLLDVRAALRVALSLQPLQTFLPLSNYHLVRHVLHLASSLALVARFPLQLLLLREALVLHLLRDRVHRQVSHVT